MTCPTPHLLGLGGKQKVLRERATRKLTHSPTPKFTTPDETSWLTKRKVEGLVRTMDVRPIPPSRRRTMHAHRGALSRRTRNHYASRSDRRTIRGSSTGNVVLRFAEAVPFAGTRGLGIKTVVLIKIERDGETIRGNLGTAPLDREGYCFKGDARRLDGATFNRD